MEKELNVVTGAFGFTGKYIARRLLSIGRHIKTLTGHPDRESPVNATIEAMPFHFEDLEALTSNLRGASVLYNTYWIRFEQGPRTFEEAVTRTATLLSAAREAGVRRIVHISSANADEASPYPFFRAKGRAERLVRESGLSYAIIRPTVLFGRESLLFNNIAWMLRHFPVFGIPGKGDYRLQPVYVDDLAELAVDAGTRQETISLDLAGPEIFTFDHLVRSLAKCVGSRARLVHLRPERALHFIRMVEALVGDTVLTRDEIDGLMHDLLTSDVAQKGRTRLSEWLKQDGALLGSNYISEKERHYR